MRTKIAILAAAALAAGVLSSQAQVYSANIVGYVNVTPVSGYNLLAAPFQAGVSNGANEVFTSIPFGTTFLTWNAGTATFTTRIYDDPDIGSATGWYLDDGFTPAPSIPVLASGQGFFMLPTALTTITFVGQVKPSPGTTNTIPIVSGYNLLGSALPVGGSLNNDGPNTLNAPKSFGNTYLLWNAASATFTTRIYDDPDIGSATGWYLDDGFTPAPTVPTLDIGQGFFLLPTALTPWSQSLTNSP